MDSENTPDETAGEPERPVARRTPGPRSGRSRSEVPDTPAAPPADTPAKEPRTKHSSRAAEIRTADSPQVPARPADLPAARSADPQTAPHDDLPPRQIDLPPSRQAELPADLHSDRLAERPADLLAEPSSDRHADHHGDLPPARRDNLAALRNRDARTAPTRAARLPDGRGDPRADFGPDARPVAAEPTVPTNIYRARRPAVAVFLIIPALAVGFLLVRALAIAAFGKPFLIDGVIASALSLASLPLLVSGLYGLITGAAHGAEQWGFRVWAKPPLAYLLIGTAFTLGAAIAIR